MQTQYASLRDAAYVHPDAWNWRIGTRLLDTVRRGQPAKIGLYAFQRNSRARRFYEARRFSLVTLGTGVTNEKREPDANYEWHRPAALSDGERVRPLRLAHQRRQRRAPT